MASLANPSLLATFPIPSTSGPGSFASSSSSSIHISPIPSPSSSSADPHPPNPELVLSAPSGGGVWIYDLSTLQAVTSYTVSPGTTLTGGPVSWNVPRGIAHRARGVQQAEGNGKEKTVRRTAVPVQAPRENDGSVWVWDGEDVFEKREIGITHAVNRLHHIPRSNSILTSSPSSSTITVLTPSLKPIPLAIPSPPAPSSTNHLVSIHMIPLATSKSSAVVTGSTTCILTYSTGRVSSFVIAPADSEEEAWTIGNDRKVDAVVGRIREGENVMDAVVDEIGGAIHLITTTGRVLPRSVSFTSSTSNGLVITRSPSTSQPYTFHATSDTAPTLPTTTILSNPSSLLISSLPSTSTSACTLVLHHPLYPSVLTTLALPRTLSRVLSIQRLGNDLVGLVGVTKAQAEAKEGHDGKEKGIVMILEVVVSGKGVGIAQLMGSDAVTREWLSVDGEVRVENRAAASGEQELEAFSERERRFLRSFESALMASQPGSEASLNKLWAEFESGIPASSARSSLIPDASRQLATRLIHSIFLATLGALPPASTPSATTNSFTNPTDALLITVQASRKQALKAAYPKEVIDGLLERDWLADGMWEEGGGILVGLARVGDWETIDVALRTFVNVPSSTLVLLLNLVLQTSAPADLDAMDTSSHSTPTLTSSIPSLKTFMHTYIRVPVSAPLHRVALFKGLRKVEEVVRVLEVLEERLQEIGADMGGLGLEEVVREVLPLSEERLIVQHITLLLDSHLDPLLSYAPAQEVLCRLNDWIGPAQRAQMELSSAKGVIEAFIRANKLDAKVEARGKQGKGGGEGEQKRMSGSLLGKREFDGLYRLEEFVL